jgi:hypothetical protein
MNVAFVYLSFEQLGMMMCYCDSSVSQRSTQSGRSSFRIGNLLIISTLENYSVSGVRSANSAVACMMHDVLKRN